MLNQTITQAQKIRGINSLIQFFDSNENNNLLILDNNWLRLQGFCCKTRKQLSDKLQTDLCLRNSSLKNTILRWSKQTEPKKPPQQEQLKEQKSLVLPSVRPLALAFTQVQRRHRDRCSSLEKKTPMRLQSMQCPISNVEFIKQNKPISSRLHAQRLRTVIEIKILQENKIIVVSNQLKDSQHHYSTDRGKEQVETLYSQFFGTVNRKRAVTICNSHDPEFDFKSHNNLEDHIRINKF